MSTSANEGKHLKMLIWSVLDLRSLILNRAGRLGLTALHQAQQLRNCFDIGLRLGAVATTWPAVAAAACTAVQPPQLPPVMGARWLRQR
jgi:hypothetical protein